MNWDLTDFVVFGALLAGLGVAFLFLARRSSGVLYRLAIGVSLATAFLLVWINGAVGIIGDEGNPANLVFAGVLATGAVVAILVRFRAGGMVFALAATAIAQVLAGVVALFAGWGAAAPAWPRDIVTLTAFFTILWLLAAWLFRRAAGDETA